MSLKIDTKKIEKSRVHIKVEVSEDVIAQWRTVAVKKVGEQVKVPGFREGKAPDDILINHIGERAILEETTDLVIQNTYVEVIKEQDLKVVARPEKVDIISVEPFVYEIIVAVYPEVKLKNYKKISIPKVDVTVTKKEIEEVVENMKKRFATYTIVERAAKNGDRVDLDFAGKDESGVVLDGTTSKGHLLILGENYFIPGFEDNLVGMNVGEEKDFTVTFPKDYHAKHLCEKPVIFHVKINKIEEMSLPAIDAEFIKKIKGNEMSEGAFLSDIEKDILGYKQEEQNKQREGALMEQLLTVGEVDLPEAMVVAEVDDMMTDYKERIIQQGLQFDMLFQHTGKTEEGLREEWKKNANDRVAVRLILQAIVEAENPEIKQEDIEHEIGHIVEHYPEDKREKVLAHYKEGGHEREELVHRLRVRNVVDGYLK